MSKAKFSYDESGATFFYFVVSFLALILIPSTYYLWPNESIEDESNINCRCSGCQSKLQHLKKQTKWQKSRRKIIRIILLVGWFIFFLVAYRCATIQHEYVNWDPFEILGIHPDASPREIKQAYRRLSLIYHPDKETGNQDKFVKITKAYAALTDDEARKNWELYGNPDGPGATSFGIALPSWIVEKENSFVVLGIYALVFMVALPVSVGLWWYKSVKYGSRKILLHTTELYYWCLGQNPNMHIKAVIKVISASLEFWDKHNPEIAKRPTDNIEVPKLIRELTTLGKIDPKDVLSLNYSVKTRAIMHAHLARMKLPQNTLEQDRCYIIKKSVYLLQEFVQNTSQLVQLAMAGRTRHSPSLGTFENGMKLCPLLVQALWEYKDPLLQLPHFTEETLRQIMRKKLKIKSIGHLARMPEKERRNALKMFNDQDYADIHKVLASMPHITMDVKFEVLDDEDPNLITAGSIVSVTLRLKRQSLLSAYASKQSGDQEDAIGADEDVEYPKADDVIESDKENLDTDATAQDLECPSDSEERDEERVVEEKAPEGKAKAKKTAEASELLDQSDSGSEDDEWNKKIQERLVKQQRILDSGVVKSHPVHCPYFPDDKQECWYLYLVDRKGMNLITAALYVTNLSDEEEYELKLTAPHKPGSYTYITICRSDSYVDCVIKKQTTIDVKPAKEYVEIPYDIPDSDLEGQEEGEESALDDSDLLTDTEDDSD